MLAVPLKKGTPTDLSQPIYTFLKTNYSLQKADEYKQSLYNLRTLRDTFLSLTNARSVSDAQLNQGASYLRAISSIDARLQINETNIRVGFRWFDSFQTSQKFDYTRISGERAAVLFNLAALYSKAGINMDRTHAASLQAGCDKFLKAATIFEKLRTEFLPNNSFGPLTSDLSPEGLKMLSSLMLAQAQYCYYLKAKMNNLTHHIQSKLAAGTAELFEIALQMTKLGMMPQVLAHSWSNHFQFQALRHRARAEADFAKHLKDQVETTGEGFGKAIGWMQASKAHCDQAINHAKVNNLPDIVLEPLLEIQREVEKLLLGAMEDNEKIYMELIPSRSQLGEVKGHISAKPQLDKIPYWWFEKLRITDEEDTDFLYRLLPIHLAKVSKVLSERFSQGLREIENEVNSKIAGVRKTLDEANISTLIEVGVPGNSGITPMFYKRVQSIVHARDGARGLLQAIKMNQDTNVKLAKEVQDGVNALKAVQQRDAAGRAKYGERWQVPETKDVDETLKKDMFRMLGYLREAEASDIKLKEKLEKGPFVTVFDSLSMEKDGLDLLLPSVDAEPDDSDVELKRNELMSSYLALDEKFAAVKASLGTYAQLVQVTEKQFLDRLLQRTEETELLEDEERLQGLVDNLAADLVPSAEEINHLMEQLAPQLARTLELGSVYMAKKKGTKAMTQRTDTLHSLHEGLEEFEKISLNVEQGSLFYEDLKERCSRTKANVDDTCFSRNMLMDDMEENLKNKPANGSARNSQEQPRPALMRQRSDPLLSRENFSVRPQVVQSSPVEVDQYGFPIMTAPPQAPQQFNGYMGNQQPFNNQGSYNFGQAPRNGYGQQYPPTNQGYGNQYFGVPYYNPYPQNPNGGR